jgi:hypothetical protein
LGFECSYRRMMRSPIHSSPRMVCAPDKLPRGHIMVLL